MDLYRICMEEKKTGHITRGKTLRSYGEAKAFIDERNREFSALYKFWLEKAKNDEAE